MRAVRIAMIVSFLGGTAAVSVAQQTDRLVVVLPKDTIPAIDRPEFEAAPRARSFDNNELMIGIVGEREQRAYSTWQLDRHEIVNDTFEGRPIAVTW
jgi:hypothetical protein